MASEDSFDSTSDQSSPDFNQNSLKRDLRRPRTLFNFLLSGFVTTVSVMAMVPLFSVLYMLIWTGGKSLSVACFTQLPPGPLDEIGGFGNAILGTFLISGIAAFFSVPFGILSAIYLAEINPHSYLSKAVRFSAKVLTGFPSILAGLFIYAVVVLFMGRGSALAGGLALMILMLPTVILTAEEAIKMVPAKMREASIGMGATQTQTIWYVLLPTALPGILTGVMLALARAAGETAPLLFTAWNNNFWPSFTSVGQPTASLAVFIYQNYKSPFPNLVELSFSASLVLVLIVLSGNILGQLIAKRHV